MSTSPSSPTFSDSFDSDAAFFAELLPPGPAGASPAETEARVVLDLESSSPLPLERLAYGWVTTADGSVLYYAAPRDRVPAHDAFAPAGSVVPTAAMIMLPEGVSPADFTAAKRDMYADVRPRPELLALRSRAVADGVIGKLARPTAVFFVIALALLMAVAGLWVNNARRAAELAEKAPAVKRTEERMVVLGTLERLDSPSRSVFDALAMVNPSRPESVGFSKVVLSENALLTVDGRATDVSSVNRMKDALKDSGHFGEIVIPKLDAASGRTNFSMKIPVTKWAPMDDAPKADAAGDTVKAEAAR